MACGDSEPGEEGGLSAAYPMAVGYSWTYEETASGSSTPVTLKYEITGKETKTFQYVTGSQEVYVYNNTFPGTSSEYRVQYLQDDGTRVTRLQHLIYDDTGTLTKQRDYNPGFLRFDRSKISDGNQWTETYTRYTDTEPADTQSTVSEQVVTYQYTVESTNQSVTVPAGTFNCVQIKRSVSGTGVTSETKVYYYADGVGKVMEITDDDKTEKLSSYSTG